MRNGNSACQPSFNPGDRIVSLVSHPPEISSGTEATVVRPYTGTLYAVMLPNGELHRWFADFELQPVGQSTNHSLKVGDYAAIISNEGHPHMIEKGTVVRIAKAIPRSFFYELRLDNGSIHRWLAEFEITYQIQFH